MARKFFYICAGMFLLALSYHLGASTAIAQAPGNPLVGVAANQGGIFAAAANGDVYVFGNGGPNTWHLSGNVFSSGPTPALRESWGQVKARYQNTPGTTVSPGSDQR
jgi:hypothetical protein